MGELPDRRYRKSGSGSHEYGCSPGYPSGRTSEEVKGVRIWGEVELAYQMGKGKVLAVTGTNGKTTTTALLGEIMKAYSDPSLW